MLLHGGPTDHREWRHQLDDLSDEYTVVAWDAPGCGQSPDPPESFRASHRAVIEGFEDAQAKTIATLERFHDERAQEQAKAQRRSRRVALAGALSALALGFALAGCGSKDDMAFDAPTGSNSAPTAVSPPPSVPDAAPVQGNP